MSLIGQIRKAVRRKALREPFTSKQMKAWALSTTPLKKDGSQYSKSSLNACLSNADVANRPTSNRNRKFLHSRINEHGKKEYWF